MDQKPHDEATTPGSDPVRGAVHPSVILRAYDAMWGTLVARVLARDDEENFVVKHYEQFQGVAKIARRQSLNGCKAFIERRYGPVVYR